MAMHLDLSSLVDLTITIRSGMAVSRRERPVSLQRRASHDKDGYVSSSLEMGTHTGTHLDAPLHFIPGGCSVDDLRLSDLIGPGSVLDLSRGPQAIGEAQLRDAIEVAGGLKPGYFAVLRTGWGDKYGTEAMHDHPYLTGDAARLLVQSKVKLVAIDAIGVDDSMASSFPAHRIILDAGIPIVENLGHLEALAPGTYGFAFLPIPLAGAESAPIRALAWRL
jgi:kynurenine formamidase